jgi:soluble lytic murein transglycosylase-like protein
LLAATALLAAAPANASSIDRWQSLIAEASARFDVPAAWIERVIRAESGGHAEIDGRPVTSAAGAMGLMQLMPSTWAALRTRLALGSDPYDPHDNILAGTLYLRLMYDRFGYPGLFAAYNAGPSRYVDHVTQGRPLPRETRAYLAAVAGIPIPFKVDRQAPANALFFVRHSARAASDTASSAGTLFVSLGTSSRNSRAISR